MKTKALSLSPLLLLLALGARSSEAVPIGTAFSYQGRLTDNGSPATGSYDLQFTLHNAASGGSQAGPALVTAPVAVNSGLFTVTLDFGGSPFDGTAYWLETGVRTNGSAVAYTTLSPRHALAVLPYAILAENSGKLGGQPATAFAPVSGSPAYVAKTGDTMTGDLNLAAPAAVRFGFTPRQMLDLYDVAYGIGVQDFTLYQRTAGGGGFAWYAGGTHSNTRNDPGTGGTSLMSLDPSGSLTLTGDALIGNSVSVNNSFYLGDSIFGSSGEVVIYGQRVFPAFAPVRFSIDPAGVLTIRSNVMFGAQTRQMLNLWSTAYGIGVQNSAFYQRTGNEFFWYKGGVHSDTFGDPGGGTQLMRLGNSGDLIVAGGLTTPVLTITGGADVAEPFKMSSSQIPAGSVVIIDDEHPGKLKMSDQAYDQRVAGIVSGANGIKPGISLSQQELSEGGQNVALSGRVYVLADASSNPIKPSDLLTTSNIPGHAMKVTDHGRAVGAIIGKAMSRLETGKGMVLVLVTLQ